MGVGYVPRLFSRKSLVQVQNLQADGGIGGVLGRIERRVSRAFADFEVRLGGGRIAAVGGESTVEPGAEDAAFVRAGTPGAHATEGFGEASVRIRAGLLH